MGLWGGVLADSRTWAHVAYVVVAGPDPDGPERRGQRRRRVRARRPRATRSWPSKRHGLHHPPVPLVLMVPAALAARVGRRPGHAGRLARDRPRRRGRCSGRRRGPRPSRPRGRRRPGPRRPRAVRSSSRETRTAAVGAADEERRRIERDLHDGAQQRLVALGVELGTARRKASSDPEAAAALEHAHREVKETLAELRDLVRGIHPAVLTDRGLDAALSALAARSPVPVARRRPRPAVAEPRQHVRAGRRVLRRRRGPDQRRQARAGARRSPCTATITPAQHAAAA